MNPLDLPPVVGASDRLAAGEGLSLPEPTTADLEAIKAEWPALAAELALVAAECAAPAAPLEVLARRRAPPNSCRPPPDGASFPISPT